MVRNITLLLICFLALKSHSQVSTAKKLSDNNISAIKTFVIKNGKPELKYITYINKSGFEYKCVYQSLVKDSLNNEYLDTTRTVITYNRDGLNRLISQETVWKVQYTDTGKLQDNIYKWEYSYPSDNLTIMKTFGPNNSNSTVTIKRDSTKNKLILKSYSNGRLTLKSKSFYKGSKIIVKERRYIPKNKYKLKIIKYLDSNKNLIRYTTKYFSRRQKPKTKRESFECTYNDKGLIIKILSEKNNGEQYEYK